MRRIPRGLACFLVVALPAAPAHGAFFPGDTVDGPSRAIDRPRPLDIGRCRGGRTAYIKRDAADRSAFHPRR